MHFSTRSKMSVLLLLAGILTIVGGFGVNLAVHASSAATQPAAKPLAGVTTFVGSASTLSSTKGTLNTKAPVAHASISSTPKLAALPVSKIRGHSLPANAGAVAAIDTGADLTPAIATAAMASQTGSVLHNFAGINSVDSATANGFTLEPPDQGLCVGTFLGQKVIIETVNNATAFYTPTGALVAGPLSNNAVFGEPAAEFMSDPRCYFDASTQTFFLTDLAIDSFSPIANHVDLLALHANGATNQVAVDVTFAGNTAGNCPCLGDQPKFGIDQSNVYISVDQFDSTLTFETGAALVAVSKSQLLSGAATVNEAAFVNLSLLGIGVTGLQPAITTGSSAQEFLLNSFEYQDAAQTQPLSTSHTLGLWAVADPQNVTAGTLPELSAVTVTSETYAFPVDAKTTNGLSLATFTNDDRMQQVQFVNGHLVAALDSAVLVKGDALTRDGAAWFEVQPTMADHADVGGATFVQQGYVATAGKFLLYPAIEQSTSGSTAIGFSFTSPTQNPSTGFVISGPGHISFSHLHTTFVGPTQDAGFSCLQGAPQQCRWGDYSATALDPNGKDFWFADER